MQLRTIRATQYVTALREGGSLPAIVAADDLGLYVLKFRGAGQGPLALVAELVAGEIGRELGLNVPELVFVEVDAALGRNEPDQEIRDLLKASVGLNLALDYLPGSFVMNVDRTPRNANLLCWHKELYFIDHGAAMYVHHDWENMLQRAESPFREVKHHVLLLWAKEIAQADERARTVLNDVRIKEILDTVPDKWLMRDNEGISAAEKRVVYHDFFSRRLAASSIFVEEANRARAELV
jgi:hypothetical protein